jgi:hypothetical protein
MDENYEIFSAETLVLLGSFALIAGPLAILASARSGLLTCATYAFLIALFVELASFEFHLSGLALALVLTLALAISWPLRRHLAPLMIAIFGVFNVATIGLAPAYSTAPPRTIAVPVQRADLPPIVHIILDEQIGLDGLADGVPGGEELRKWLLGFLEAEGFAVFGRAYSRYFYTRDSIPSAFNFRMNETPEGLYSGGGSSGYALEANEYLRLAREKGYSIHVFQTGYLDFCRTPDLPIEACHTYSQTNPSGPAWNEIDVFKRSLALAGVYGWSSFLASSVWTAFSSIWSELSPDAPIPQLLRGQWNLGVAPITAVSAFDRLIEDVGRTKRGTLYLAHLLLPHNPFILDRDCRIKATLVAWREPFPSTAEDRRERYVEYLDQIRCTFRKVAQLLDRMKAEGIFDDALIVIHGDHGSRIGPSLVDFENRDLLTPQSYLDAFSTLVAIRAPGYASGYHSGLSNLPLLLREFATGSQERTPEEPNPFVYLTEGNPGHGLRWHRVPFTGFGGAPRETAGPHRR